MIELREKSIIIETDYGRVIVFVHRGRTRLRLQRRIDGRWLFVRPSPKALQVVCAKRFEETKGKGWKSTIEEGEMILTAELEDGAPAENVNEIYDWLANVLESCRLCYMCGEVKWETTNCANVCLAETELVAVEVRPIPPAIEADCYMWFRTGYGLVECDCEPLRYE